MTGTSIDSVDLVLVEIAGNGLATKLNQIDFQQHQFPQGLKSEILKISSKTNSSVEDICKINFLLPHIFAEAIQKLCEKNNMKLSDIDLIGSHGQTIQHSPSETQYFGFLIKSTLQIGDPSALAKLTGILTVGDFRNADVALKGQGAPLVPQFDQIIFRSTLTNRLLLNIGGIANFTVLKKNAQKKDIVAFDTGPGNMLIDFLMRKFFNKEFDIDGQIAFQGKENRDFLKEIAEKDKQIIQPPPKSTGREQQNEDFLKEFLEKQSYVDKKDWICTITIQTAYAIQKNFEQFILKSMEIDELIISGGGSKNKFLVQCLHNFFGPKVKIMKTDELGIASDAKEALCFAVLANETISGNPANIPNVTGSVRETILGKICLP